MKLEKFLRLLICPSCQKKQLRLSVFSEKKNHAVDGIAMCKNCHQWYPIDDGLLELLTPPLAYSQDRRKFIKRYHPQLRKLNLRVITERSPRDQQLSGAKHQQKHSDWYADNKQQTYYEYERQPFWQAVDRQTFTAWRKDIKNGSLLLDIGCANGRSTFQIADLPINILAFDISKKLVRQALDRYQKGHLTASIIFFVADATHLPFSSAIFDSILVYGVLHHLRDPHLICQKIASLLRPGGFYFGCENNQTIFRRLFDLLQIILPLWHEEAGPEALISPSRFHNFFQNTGVHLRIHTSVYLPPHLFNFFSPKQAHFLLKFSDKIGQNISLLSQRGGLVILRGQKQNARIIRNHHQAPK